MTNKTKQIESLVDRYLDWVNETYGEIEIEGLSLKPHSLIINALGTMYNYTNTIAKHFEPFQEWAEEHLTEKEIEIIDQY